MLVFSALHVSNQHHACWRSSAPSDGGGPQRAAAHPGAAPLQRVAARRRSSWHEEGAGGPPYTDNRRPEQRAKTSPSLREYLQHETEGECQAPCRWFQQKGMCLDDPILSQAQALYRQMEESVKADAITGASRVSCPET